jgi:ABC-type glycerol-3-phosphate transport system permease component
VSRRARSAIAVASRSLLLCLLAVPFALPLIWMVATAFKTTGQVYSLPPTLVPRPPSLENLRTAWGLLPWPRYFANTLFIAGLSMLGSVVSSSAAGFAFATLPARGKRTWFAFLLATIMLPATVSLVPSFILYAKLGWVNSYLPLIVPQFLGNGFYVFLFRQYFRGLPSELYDSARLDGCNPLQAFWHIALPLARPAVATVAVFAFVASWNDFLGPLIYLSSTDKYTVALGLSLFQGMYYTQLHYLMPMALVALAPIVVLFLVAQRSFARGIVATGPKR